MAGISLLQMDKLKNTSKQQQVMTKSSNSLPIDAGVFITTIIKFMLIESFSSEKNEIWKNKMFGTSL